MSTQMLSLTRLFEKMEEGMMIVDRDRRILFANDLARRYLALPATADQLSEELLPKLSQKFVLSDELQDVSLADDDDERSIAFEATTAPDVSRPVTLSIYMSRPNEEGTRFILLRDVTLERNEELWKQRLLSLISHKLMTPLNVVKMGISNLSAGVAGETTQSQKDILDRSMRKVRALEKMVSRLIHYASMQATQVQLPPKPLDAAAAIEDFVERFLRQEHSRAVSIEVHCDAPGATIAVRREHFLTALESLLDNAVKFHHGEEAHIDVALRKDAVTRDLEIAISDDGPGIPPAIQRDIMKEFFQRDDELTGNVEGMGLGLPLVKNLMELAAGRIELESEEGRGTTVHLYFPPADQLAQRSAPPEKIS